MKTVTKICARCGKNFEVKQYRNKTAKYCSLKCRSLLTTEQLEDFYLKQKLSTVKIGKIVGASAPSIHRLLKTKGIPIRNLSESHLGQSSSPATQFTSEKMKGLWKDSAWIKKNREAMFASLNRQPNKPETVLMRLIEKNNLPFIYSGNGKIIIEGLNPDFVSNDGKRRIIEIYGRAFHDQFNSIYGVLNWKKGYWGRKAVYKVAGYDAMIFWEEEIYEKSENIVKRIQEWSNDNFSKVGSDTIVYPTVKIVHPDGFFLGDKVILGDFAFISVKKLTMEYGSQIAPHAIISGGGEVHMEAFSVVGFGSQLITGTDTTEGKLMCEAASPHDRKVIRGSITLEEGAYVGSGAIICVSEKCPNIVIGEHAVVGALSYIDRNVEPNMVVHPKMEYVVKVRDRKNE